MTSKRSMFKELDESHKIEVKLGDNKKIQVEGNGIVAIRNGHGKMKLLHNVFFVPSLAHNLLSVGQLMVGGYSKLFDDASCCIKDNKIGQVIAHVRLTTNKNISS